jgi:hypothetical protein
MQVEVIKNKQPKEFQPITLQVTIETKEELFSLFSRLSLTSDEVNSFFNEEAGDITSKDELFELYWSINKLVDLETN